MKDHRALSFAVLLFLVMCLAATIIISPSFLPGILVPLAGVVLILIMASWQNLGMRIPVLVKGRTDKKQVALTFDDGPHPDFTPRILEILERYQAPACFFCLGWRVENFPEIVREIVSRGHEVGNHSYRHPIFLAFYTVARLRQEVAKTQQAFLKCLGVQPLYYRQPLGILNPFLNKVLKEERLRLVGCSLYAKDNDLDTSQAISRYVIEKVRPGQVIILHDGLANRPHSRYLSVEALPRILDALHKGGYQFVSLKTLMEDS